MKQKAIVFHPAIAPYRIDLFNSLNDLYAAEFYFEFDNAVNRIIKYTCKQLIMRWNNPSSKRR